MKNTIDRTHKLSLYVCILLFILSLAYIITYDLVLRDISAITYTIRYGLLNLTIARPVFFMTLTALVCTWFLLWANKDISQKTKRSCLILFILLSVAYTLLLIVYLTGGLPLPIIMSRSSIFSPALPAALGMLLAIIIQKNQEQDAGLNSES